MGLFIGNEATSSSLPPADHYAREHRLDAFGGSIPIGGDLFDAYFTANLRNLEIAFDHFGMSVETSSGFG